MKRVGIITYHNIADGKGRFLQAYALYKTIEGLGYDTNIIDYYPITKEQGNNTLYKKLMRAVSNPKKIPGYIVKLLHDFTIIKYKCEFREKRRKYEEFIKNNIKVTDQKYYGIDSLNNLGLEYDAYVCGSDQIWNPYFQGMDLAYYLKFAPVRKRIAYAPSLGTVQIDEYRKNFMKLNISEIPFVSVREESGARLVSELIGRDVKNVLDPTLLLTQQWWNEFAGDTIPEIPYVLTFFFDNSRYPRKIAKEVAKKNGYNIISIPDSFSDIFFKSKKEISIGPEKFANLFKNASFICTQSFHGTILSLIYNRPFYVFNRQTKAYVSGVFSRIQDLLEKVELSDRILQPGQPLPKDYKAVDFNNANRIINNERDKSIAFLKNALEKATECD